MSSRCQRVAATTTVTVNMTSFDPAAPDEHCDRVLRGSRLAREGGARPLDQFTVVALPEVT